MNSIYTYPYTSSPNLKIGGGFCCVSIIYIITPCNIISFPCDVNVAG